MNEVVIEKDNVQTIEKTSIKIYPYIKRAFDFSFALICSLFFIPIMLIVILLIRIDSKGPAIFTQDRIGKDGKTIKIYKFRTMVMNAEEELKRLLETDPKIREEYTVYKKITNDPRLTKIGGFLRKASIDELPQILNILKGEMSLIGPRPYLHRELPDMEGYEKYITAFRPGLTGMWQVNGRNETTFQERLEFDQEYYQKFSVKLDTKIFFKTIQAVFKKDGAK